MTSRARALASLLAVAVAVVAGTIVVTAHATDRFPHYRHARLFPLCTGCHAGIEAGDRAEFYPPPASCTSCHDGTTQPRVEWDGPRPYLTNLVFAHAAHQTAAVARDGAPLECEQCHSVSQENRMTVRRANPEVCFACHAHRATDHFRDARCQTCHVPLVQSPLPATRLPTLPEPTDHFATDFVSALHGAHAQSSTQRCAVCHTKERCVVCHVNAADVAEIDALPAAPDAWVMPSWTAHYPEPASHRGPDWLAEHGSAASRAACGACHTQQDCTTCHVAAAPAVLETLPAAADVTAPGARTTRQAPPSHASRFFERDHAALAAAQPESCAACHEKQFCAECHDAPRQPSYHPRNFTAQHASAAYGRRLECASCHEVRTFCRACHIQLGMQTQGRLDPGFHDAEPLWLLRHARAARQGLESCTSCHDQRDCLQCHSTLGAFRINPHGPEFDARRAQRRNPTICFACHTNDPLRGGL